MAIGLSTTLTQVRTNYKFTCCCTPYISLSINIAVPTEIGAFQLWQQKQISFASEVHERMDRMCKQACLIGHWWIESTSHYYVSFLRKIKVLCRR